MIPGGGTDVRNAGDPTSPYRVGRPSRALRVAAAGIVVLLLLLRLTQPSDLWDQSQPRTISYTTDIVENGRWILPVEPGVKPATKPPLYNWIAAPFVASAGHACEIAHRAPSVLATLVLLVAMGRWIPRLLPALPAGSGWCAGAIMLATYPVFKLSALARPDMCLVAATGLGWMSGAACVAAAPGRSIARWRLQFWAATAAALLAKGPPGLLLPLWAGAMACVIARRRERRAPLSFAIGLPLALVPIGAWVVAAAMLDPAHVRDELLHAEIAGRVTGLGPEGGGGGPWRIVTGILVMPFYLVVRFLPWSIPGLLGIWMLRPGAARRDEPAAACGPDQRRVLEGAALFVLGAVVFFSLSAGKRADYLAVVATPLAVLATWGLHLAARGTARRAVVVLTSAAMAAAITGLALHSRFGGAAPARGFGDAIGRAAREARAAAGAAWPEVRLVGLGAGPLRALLGRAQPDDPPGWHWHDASPGPVLVGWSPQEMTSPFMALLTGAPGPDAVAWPGPPVLEGRILWMSPVLATVPAWPGRIALLHIGDPAPARPGGPGPIGVDDDTVTGPR